MNKKQLLFCLLACAQLCAYSQKNLPLTADSLATGNYKDVFNSFFQLAFDKLTSNEKEVRFTSNPFAVMAKMDTTLLVDTSYYRYRHLRDLNFSFAAKLDNSYKFNGFSSGVKYAIINKRDETVSRAFLHLVAADPGVKEFKDMNLLITGYINSIHDAELQVKMQKEYVDFLDGKTTFNKLNPSFQKAIKELAEKNRLVYFPKLIEENSKFNMKVKSTEIYDKYKDYFNNRPLWTIGISDTTYQNQFFFSNLVLTTEFVKGIDSLKNKDIELNLRAALQYVDDSSHAGRDLNRHVFSFEPGFNFVWKAKNTKKSFFEWKLSGSYEHTFSSLYPDEKRDRILFNNQLRIRVLNDIWIPLEIKYDPESGNVFGFLNVRANFTALGKALK